MSMNKGQVKAAMGMCASAWGAWNVTVLQQW